MNITQKFTSDRFDRDKLDIIEFSSINELYQYITTTPDNKVFYNRVGKASDLSTTKWCSLCTTDSFEEAVHLMKTGWYVGTSLIAQNIDLTKDKLQKRVVSKNVYDVQGYQPVVPLYLNCIPTNMVDRKQNVIKQKVLNIDKYICYSYRVKSDTIIENCSKAVSIIDKLEHIGYRCNINVVATFQAPKTRHYYIIKVMVKSASERLNLHKMSFPLANPSMLRRLITKFLEVYPNMERSMVKAYGYPCDYKYDTDKSTIILPSFISKSLDKINTIKDLYNV